MSRFPAPSKPTLAERAVELRSFSWPGALLEIRGGRELRYRFKVSPSAFGRMYECMLIMKPDSRAPVVLVLRPDLMVLANGRKLPHVYPHAGRGTSLCLWRPKRREWQSQMRIVDSFIAWTSEWLWYFEDWLATHEWRGGGEHPSPTPKRWSDRRKRSRSASC